MDNHVIFQDRVHRKTIESMKDINLDDSINFTEKILF